MVQPQLRAKEKSAWTEIKMPIDNGAAANCLKMEDYKQIEDPPKLERSEAKLISSSGNRIVPEGQVSLDIKI